jgi:predicted metal-dependent hydrolase
MSPLQLLLPWWTDSSADAQPSSEPLLDSHLTPSSLGMTGLSSSPLRSHTSTESSVSSALAVYRHPEAQHEMKLGNLLVGFELKQCKRRSIGMVVSPEGLTVRAPRWATWSDIEQALQDKSRWICAKLVDQRDKGQRQAAARILWEEGASVPYLGEPLVLMLSPGQEACRMVEQDMAVPGVARRVLHVGAPADASPDLIRERVLVWLHEQALKLYEQRLAHFSAIMGVSVKRLRLSAARTRWGSASADGTIRLHWKLIHFSATIIDYVVVHELAHLKEMNHSPRFWRVVASALPDYELPLEQLRHVAIPE